MSPTRWRQWARWMLNTQMPKGDFEMVTVFRYGGESEYCIGTIQERALYAYFIARFLETE
jgi:hypothetical protein